MTIQFNCVCSKCTLTGGTTKWYIELEMGKYSTFGDLAMVFLNHFQLPVRYDAKTELLIILSKIRPHTFLIISRNGGEGRA
jgi:hypothetical protein